MVVIYIDKIMYKMFFVTLACVVKGNNGHTGKTLKSGVFSETYFFPFWVWVGHLSICSSIFLFRHSIGLVLFMLLTFIPCHNTSLAGCRQQSKQVNMAHAVWWCAVDSWTKGMCRNMWTSQILIVLVRECEIWFWLKVGRPTLLSLMIWFFVCVHVYSVR